MRTLIIAVFAGLLALVQPAAAQPQQEPSGEASSPGTHRGKTIGLFLAGGGQDGAGVLVRPRDDLDTDDFADAAGLSFGVARRDPPGGSHVAFRSEDRATVDAFHVGALSAGGQDNGAPGLRPDYGEHYYAAFVRDADGNNVEAVCQKPE